MPEYQFSAFADEITNDIETQMEELKKYGISHIELRAVDGINVSEFTMDKAKEIKQKLDKNGFSISAIGSPIGKIKITDPFEPHLQTFRHVIKLAKLFETKYIRIFSFFIPEGDAPEQYEEEVIRRMKAFVEIAEQEDVMLLHENEKDIFGDITSRCLKIFDRIPSKNLRATFDMANFVQCGVKPYEAYKTLKPYIEYVHIKDARSIDHMVVPAGYGDGQVETIIGEMIENGYQGFFSFEPHLGSFPGLDKLETKVEIKENHLSGQERFKLAYDAFAKIIDKVGGK